MKLNTAVFLFAILCVSLAGWAQVPNAHLKLWLSADSVEIINNKVAIWYDISENSYLINQSLDAHRPVKLDSVLNHQSVIDFSTGNVYLNGGDILDLNNNSHTYFIIARSQNGTIISKTSSSNTQGRYAIILREHEIFYLYQTTSANNLQFIDNTFDSNAFNLITIENNRNNSENKLFINSLFKTSVVIINSTFEFNTNFDFLLGGFGNSSGTTPPYSALDFNGQIAEIIIYDTVLNDSARKSIESYLMDKYATAIELGADISSDYGFCDTLLYIDSTFTDILWSTGETNDSIIVNESGIYTVAARDIFDRMQYDTITVSYPNPNFSDTTICLGDSVAYAVDLSGPYDYLWSQGSTDSLIWIKEAGNYSVQLIDTNGCSKSFEFFVNVDSFVNQVDLGPNLVLCSGNSIGLISGAELVSDYLWSPGGNTDSIQVVNTTGWQHVVVNNALGCSVEDSVYVTVSGTAPTPAYSIENLCFGENTIFTDESTSPETIIERMWVFNEIDTLFGSTVDYQFANSGVKNVELRVTSASGCANSLYFQVTIKPIPEVNFTYTPVCAGVEMNFISDISIPTETSINTYQWYLDGIPLSTTAHLDYTFVESGNYTLELMVNLDNSCSANYVEPINVIDSYSLPESFSLVNPANNILIAPDSSNMQFSWNLDAMGISYLFQISDTVTFSNILFEVGTTHNSVFTSIDYDYDTIFWRVISYNPCLNSVQSEIRMITQFSPSLLSNNALWLKADSVETNSDSVSKWYDLSYNNYELIQPIENYRPIRISNAINNYPAIQFNGINSYLIGGDILDIKDNSNSYFIVSSGINGTVFSKAAATSISNRYALIYDTNNFLWFYHDNTQRNIDYQNPEFNNSTYNLIHCTNNKLVSKNTLYINNHFINEISINSTHTFDSDFNFLIGAYANSTGGLPPFSSLYLDGSIAEIIIYDTVLNETETELVHQYLRHKYAPPVNLGYDIDVPYGFCDTTITTADKPWFTDYLWSTGDTTPTISTNHNGEYSVTVTDIFGFTSTDDIRVNFPRVYEADALSMVCDGDTLVWDAGLSNESYNFNWLNSASTQAYAGYWQNQQAAVQITDTNGCSFFTDTVDIMLDMFEHTAALGDGDTALCIGNRLSLANGFDEAVDFLWQDGSTEPEFLIETAGTYHVTVSNALGCTARDTIDVSILGTVPEPDFTVSGQCAEASIQLNDASSSTDGNITNWEWTYNNEIFATGESSSISFDSMGIYDIQLEVFTDVGCHQSISQSIQIHPLPEPDFSPLTACSNQPVIFENLSSIPQGNMQSSEWQFGSGSEWISADMQAITHEFTNAGMQTVSLSVTSEAGCEKQISKQVEVRQSPQAAFSTSPRCDGEAVIFWNQTDAQGTQLWEYQWNFGDGNNSTASDPQHLYPDTGNYTVNMSVKSLNGCTDTASMTITVYSLPQAAVENLNACLGVAHQLADITDASAGAIVAREWQVAGLQLTGENPSIQLDSLGSYPLTLHVTTEYGCTSQIDTLLMVRENPDADFELPQTWGAVPLSLSLENTSLGGDSYIWHFGDGESANEENPQHVWQDSGNYEIQLIAVSPYGCTDSLSKNLRVIIPLIDVGIISLQTSMPDNYLQVSADIINPGTVPITDLALELDPGNGEITREILPNEFAEGAVMRYTFNSQPYFASGKLPEYVCVSLDPGVPDDVPENNQLCNLHDAGFSLQSMYPNPVNDLLNLHVLLPRDGNLQLQVFDAVGQQVKSLNLELNSGYHALALDCASLSSGRYQVRLSFEEEEIYKGFIK